MSNWRISVFEKDNTNTVDVSGPIIGATAIKAPKGPAVFTRFEKGATQSLIDAFGYPSVSYPGIQDAIDFNNTAPLFVAAPAGSGGTYGGVFVTTAGTLPFVSGTAAQSISNYATISCTHQVGVQTGTGATFTTTLPHKSYYNNTSITSVKNGGSTITVTASDAATEILTGSGLTTGSQYVRSTGALTLVFSSPPTLANVITVTYTINLSAVILFTLYDKYVQADDLKVKIVKQDVDTFATDKIFAMYVSRYDPVTAAYVELVNSPIYFGISPTSKDAYGENIYIENILGDEQYLFKPVVQNSTISSFTEDSAFVALTGGSRGSAPADSDIASAYEALKDQNVYPVSLVFDTLGADEVATEFSSLRNGVLKYTSFAVPTADVSAATIIASPATYRTTSSRGIFCYALTWGTHTDVFQGNHFLCSNMGLVAERIVTSMLLDPSAQPAYINENGCGGQLKAGIRKLNQSLTDTEAEQLELAKINPVVIDPQYGAMIVGWRTTNSLNNVYSYIAQSVQADMMIKQIIRDALVPQQGKPNDDLHRTTVTNQTTAILDQFARGLDARFVKCDATNNTADIMNQQKFVLSVAVRFVAYAKTIVFNFVTTRFGTSVEEAIN